MGQRAANYARVSTSDQSCERQVSELSAFAERSGYDVVGIFKETASGASANRVARNRVLDLAQARQIDAILVSELSRWGRSTQDLLDTLNRLAGWKVSVVAMSGMTFEVETPHGRMMATMLAGIAQFERDLLSERVRSGLAAARARGKRLGRQPARPTPEIRQARAKGRSSRGRRSIIPLDRTRSRDQQKYRARYYEAAATELLVIRFCPLPESTPGRPDRGWNRSHQNARALVVRGMGRVKGHSDTGPSGDGCDGCKGRFGPRVLQVQQTASRIVFLLWLGPACPKTPTGMKCGKSFS